MSSIQCDSRLRTEAVQQYIQDANLQDYQIRIHIANQCHEQQKQAMLDQANNEKAAEKKLTENDLFFRRVLNAEICELIGSLVAIEYQQNLELTIIEELKIQIQKYIDEQELMQQVAAEQLSQEHKQAIEAIVKEALEKAENNLNNLEAHILSIEHDWGGSTWKEGVEKHAETLSKNFANDFLGINLSNKTDEEKKAINDILASTRQDLKQDLQRTLSPEEGLNILNKAEPTPPAHDAPGVPDAPPPPPMMKPTIRETTVKSQVMAEMKFFFALKKLSDNLNKILPPEEQIRMNVKEIAIQVKKQEGLEDFLKKIEKFSELPDLKSGLVNAKALVQELKSKEALTPATHSIK